MLLPSPTRPFYPISRPLQTSQQNPIEQLQADLDAWMREYNEIRTHQGRWCFGRTPMQTFLDTVPLAKEKIIQVA